MRKNGLAICLVAFVASAPLAAADFVSFGFEVKGSQADGSTLLSDQKGTAIRFVSEGEPTNARLEALASLIASFHSWDGLSIATIEASNEASRLRVTLLPQTLVVSGRDLAPNVPGGITFFYGDGFEYDFRVLSGIWAIRMVGVYTTGRDLLSSVSEAATDPAGWLLKRDPTFVVKLAKDLEGRIIKLEAADVAQKDELSATKAGESEDTRRLEDALMAALNVGFLHGPRPIDPKFVEWVVERRAADPSATKAALVAAAKADKIAITEKEIGIVLLVKFGER